MGQATRATMTTSPSVPTTAAPPYLPDWAGMPARGPKIIHLPRPFRAVPRSCENCRAVLYLVQLDPSRAGDVGPLPMIPSPEIYEGGRVFCNGECYWSSRIRSSGAAGLRVCRIGSPIREWEHSA